MIKKFLSCALSIAILFTTISITPICAKAVEITDFECSYSGYYDDVTTFDFSINNVDKEKGTFNGHVIIKDNESSVDVDKDVSGTIEYYEDCFICNFSVKYRWLFSSYTATFKITAFPFEGKAVGSGGGGILFGIDDFQLNGTVLKYYSEDFSYNENDMKMCMALSNEMYSAKSNDLIKNNIETILSNYCSDIPRKEIVAYNYSDDKGDINTNKNDAPFAIMNRKYTDNNSIDIIVAIRGTYYNEWQGNTEITGEHYDPKKDVHVNFNEAKVNIQSEIKDYYEKYAKDYDQVNLIITGHSRGAAVANLYAKEATDVIKDTKSIPDIPKFDNVTAYTFACPNVAKTDEKNVSSMEKYTNIYNFWFDTDIVPTVPLTSPTKGWGYWKYGRCYTIESSKWYNLPTFLDKSNLTVFHNTVMNKKIKFEEEFAFLQWPTVDDYYNKLLYRNDETVKYTTLYNFLHTATYLMSANDKDKWNALPIISDIKTCSSLAPLLCFALKNLYIIYKSHSNETYNAVINGKDTFEGIGGSEFHLYTYEQAVSDSILFSEKEEQVTSSDDIAPLSDGVSEVNYNAAEVQKLSTFANYGNNNEILNWDLNDPSSWDGVIWNESGNVVSINFVYKWLEGRLDCSDFTALENVNVYANMLTEIDLSNDSSLVSLNCNYNDLSQSGLDLSGCTGLTELYCDGCGISTLDISSLTNLQTLSCAFNKLTALNIQNNSKLEHISCSYNYLDIHEGGTLNTALNNYKTANSAYVNDFPQLLPNDAVIDSNELQTLEDFAKNNGNNAILDWLDDEGNISVDKVQNNVLFEYDGEKYRAVAIDISELDVEGSLDLSSFSYLKYFYCYDSKISSLNLNGCTNLEILSCEGAKISGLNLPNNISTETSKLFAVSCEYNYIDTSIFTDGIVNSIKSKPNYYLKYENQKGDSSALQSALQYANTLEEKDYSAESFSVLRELIDECNCYDFDNLYLNQAEIDAITGDILTTISELKAYFTVRIDAQNGYYDVSTVPLTIYFDEESFTFLQETTITLGAIEDNGCHFVGWYDTVNNRYLSTEKQYKFTVNSNISLKAICVPDGSTTLTFANHSGWVAGMETKTTTEWAKLTTIADLLPDVPYRYGYSNGRWVYDDAQVLAQLQSGQDVTITAEYDSNPTSLPTPRPATDKPLLDLYYNYDSANNVGSFVMAAGFPNNIQLESVGVAFYYDNASWFDPTDNFHLFLNNQKLVSRFNTDELEDTYIVNINNMNPKLNWAARGFVTYYDANGDLKTEYSNQINVVNREQAF